MHSFHLNKRGWCEHHLPYRWLKWADHYTFTVNISLNAADRLAHNWLFVLISCIMHIEIFEHLLFSFWVFMLTAIPLYFWIEMCLHIFNKQMRSKVNIWIGAIFFVFVILYASNFILLIVRIVNRELTVNTEEKKKPENQTTLRVEHVHSIETLAHMKWWISRKKESFESKFTAWFLTYLCPHTQQIYTTQKYHLEIGVHTISTPPQKQRILDSIEVVIQ